jgi:hypothetical protein
LNSFTQVLKDKRVIIPILFFICLEFFFHSGIYKPFLKKNSYAANINRITDHIIKNKESQNPDILVLGTSVAYQGLSMRILQDKLSPLNYKIQSTAIPGSELIIQELTSKKVLKEFDKVRYLIYVAEVTMPWVIHTELQLPTLAMMGEFPLQTVKNTLPYHGYSTKYKIPIMDIEVNLDYTFSDFAFLHSKTIAYRRDINDFLFDPAKRLKHISRTFKNPNQNFYDFENDHEEKMSSYPMNNLTECLEATKDFGPPYPENSNYDHKKAIFETCALSVETINALKFIETSPNSDTEKSKLYFKRLSRVFQPYLDRNIQIIVTFAPYSHVMGEIGGKKKMDEWIKELKSIDDQKISIVDFQNLFEKENSNDYCYDTIHLNKMGMEKFSNALGDNLINQLKDTKTNE